MNPILLQRVWSAWEFAGLAAGLLAGMFGMEWLLRTIYRGLNPPLLWLREHQHPLTRWALRRNSAKAPWLWLGLMAFSWGLTRGARWPLMQEWAAEHGVLFLGVNVLVLLIPLLVLAFWNNHPRYVLRGEGRADAQFRDLPEDWGRFELVDGRPTGDGRPVATLLGYREATKAARRALLPGQRRGRSLSLIALRWDLLSRHIFIIGPQGSGKTSTIYSHIMHSATGPWIYQDSKAELPLRASFPQGLVWGLDVRGHESRSGVWNPLEEIRSAEDFDLIVDYVFPTNPKDPNAWVRDMARVLFSAVLRSRRWASLQAISRALRAERLEPFLEPLDPIWKDLLKEPKSQVPVLQDLVATLARWETPRVSAITEGTSTLTLDAFIAKGGWAMNCEMADALRAPVYLFWAMLIGRLRNRTEGASPLLLLMDEFGDAGRLPSIERALVLLRSKGVAFVAGIQNVGLLKDVYPQNWQAVAQGFGSKIWLLRNAEDEIREGLSRALGKWTRRVRAANAKSRDTEKDVDLMPLDAWGAWSDERAALARSNGFTYWLPLSLSIPRTPLGPPITQQDPWLEAEARAEAARRWVQSAAEKGTLSPTSLPSPPPAPAIPGLELLQGLRGVAPPALQPADPGPTGHAPGVGSPLEDEWL